jgi:hypothetical protein
MPNGRFSAGRCQVVNAVNTDEQHAHRAWHSPWQHTFPALFAVLRPYPLRLWLDPVLRSGFCRTGRRCPVAGIGTTSTQPKITHTITVSSILPGIEGSKETARVVKVLLVMIDGCSFPRFPPFSEGRKRCRMTKHPPNSSANDGRQRKN